MRSRGRAWSASRDLELAMRLRDVLRRAVRGMGFSAAFVQVFLSSRESGERDAVRRVLLGTPPQAAMGRIAHSRGSAGELLLFLAALSRVSASEAGRGAGKLSSMFERWTLLKERSAMEWRVMQFRGLVVSAVAGVVVGMLSALAPLISGFQISLGAAAQHVARPNPYLGALFLLPSALSLGLFLSPRRPYLNAAVALAAFVCVVSFVGPLAMIGTPP